MAAASTSRRSGCGSVATLECGEPEAERLLLWAILEQKKAPQALSSLTVDG